MVFFAVKNYLGAKKTKKANANGSESDNNNNGGNTEVPTTSAPSINHIGKLVTIPKADGGELRGYEFPDNVNQLTFPIWIITKPDSNLPHLQPEGGVQILKDANGTMKYRGISSPSDGEYAVTYEDLKRNALVL